MTVLILPDGGRGTGPNPSGVDYPFLKPDVVHLLADFSLGYRMQSNLRGDVAQPLQIVWLSGFDTQFNYPSPGSSGSPPPGKDFTPTNPADVVVWDANNQTVFDSTQHDVTYHGAPLGNRLYIHEWVSPYAVCRAIQHIAFPSLDDVIVFPPQIWPTSGWLDPRTVARRPSNVTSIAVGTADLYLAPWARPLEGLQSLDGFPASGVTLPMTGPTNITAGYNIVLTAGPTVTKGLRRVTQVTISAIGGEGSGYAPAVAAVTGLRKINGITADARGNVNLAGVGCYSVRQPTEVTSAAPRLTRRTPATVTLTNDCDVCCACADYAATARAVIALWNRFKTISASAADVNSDYNVARDRWTAAKSCRESKWLSLAMTVHELQYVEVEATFTNHVEECITHLTLSIKVGTTPTTAYTIAEGTTFQTDGDGNTTAATLTPTATGYKAYWATVPPQSRVAVRFRLIIAALPCVLLLTLTGSGDGAHVPGSAWESLTLPDA